MRQLLIGAGLFFFGRRLFNSAVSTVQSNVDFSFRGIAFNFLNFDNTRIRVQFEVLNTNPVPVVVNRFEGVISLGAITSPVVITDRVDIVPNKKVVVTAWANVNNRNFILQLVDLIGAGSVPQPRIKGRVNIGLDENRTVTLPVDQVIPLL